jgi:hypothetical protein
MPFTPKTDLDPRHYRFERQIKDFYVPRETYHDKLGDRVVTIVAVLVICLILMGVLNG